MVYSNLKNLMTKTTKRIVILYITRVKITDKTSFWIEKPLHFLGVVMIVIQPTMPPILQKHFRNKCKVSNCVI